MRAGRCRKCLRSRRRRKGVADGPCGHCEGTACVSSGTLNLSPCRTGETPDQKRYRRNVLVIGEPSMSSRASLHRSPRDTRRRDPTAANVSEGGLSLPRVARYTAPANSYSRAMRCSSIAHRSSQAMSVSHASRKSRRSRTTSRCTARIKMPSPDWTVRYLARVALQRHVSFLAASPRHANLRCENASVEMPSGSGPALPSCRQTARSRSRRWACTRA